MIVKQQAESIKLSKMSKGYQWEIRILSTNIDGHLTVGDLKRIDDLNKDLERRYGYKDED